MKKFRLRGKDYTKTSALEATRAILHRYPLSTYLPTEDFLFILDLISFHPNAVEKIGNGIRAIQIVEEKVFKNKRFDIVHKDNTRIDFSYIRCLDNKNLHVKDVKQAFRYIIAPQIMSFKKKAFGKKKYVRCAITNLNTQWKDCHVDHKSPLSFDRLLSIFLKIKNLSIEKIEVRNISPTQVTLADSFLAGNWFLFHQKHAELRVTLDHANLGQKREKVIWENNYE